MSKQAQNLNENEELVEEVQQETTLNGRSVRRSDCPRTRT